MPQFILLLYDIGISTDPTHTPCYLKAWAADLPLLIPRKECTNGNPFVGACLQDIFLSFGCITRIVYTMEIASILSDIEYGDTKPAIKVLFNNASVKEIRIAFKEGQEMREHQTNHPIVVEIVEGAIDFGVAGTVHHLDKGMLIALEAGVPHNLVARASSIVRLSLSKADTVERVQQV